MCMIPSFSVHKMHELLSVFKFAFGLFELMLTKWEKKNSFLWLWTTWLHSWAYFLFL